MAENKVCGSCGSQDEKILYQATENMLGLKDEFTYHECTVCNSLQIFQKPEDLSRYYSSDYYTSTDLKLSHGLKNIFKRIRWQLFNRGIASFHGFEFLQWLKPLKLKQTTKIADIGCGNGQLLYEMYCSGFSDLHGFDAFLNEEKVFDGLTLSRCDVFEIQDLFDVVMLHHSFEHMEEPKRVFEKLISLLNPNGKILIRVPVTDAEVWQNERVNWFQLDAPRHLFIPSLKAMKSMGEAVGLSLEQVVFDSNENQFIVTEMYKQGFSLKGNDPVGFVNRAERKEYKEKAKRLNQLQKGDQACFYFQKL